MRTPAEIADALSAFAHRSANPTRELEALLFEAAQALRSQPTVTDAPNVVTLCGSTRFYDAFQEANFRLTIAGYIVLSVGFYPHTKSAHELEHGEHVGITEREKEALDILHKRKIDMSNEVFVLNVGGYIGDSTRSEIEHALKVGIPVRYLEDPDEWTKDAPHRRRFGYPYETAALTGEPA
jgi:hypothetical protein